MRVRRPVRHARRAGLGLLVEVRHRATGPMYMRLLAAAALIASGAVQAGTAIQHRSDWAGIFSSAGVTGTVVVVDERTSVQWVHDRARAATRYQPASTFKIPHALFALDAGVVRDEFQRFPWNGVRREIASWNRDQDLRSSMRNSTVWVYQWIARTLGEPR